MRTLHSGESCRSHPTDLPCRFDLLDFLPGRGTTEKVEPFHQNETHERLRGFSCLPGLWDRTEPARLLVVLEVAWLLNALEAFPAMGLEVTVL